jgi:iron complex outermembrane receptor protein
VRTPSRIDGEFFAPRDPPFTQLQGNPDFESEELLAYELGYRAQPFQNFSLSLALFHHDYDRLRSIERINPTAQFPIFLGNLQEGTSTGGELTAEYHATGAWRLRAGYTQMHLSLHNKAGSTALPPTHTDSEHQFFLRSSVDLPGNLEWDVSYRRVARIESAAVPAYGEVDMRLGWAPTDTLELSVVGQNLFNPRHAEFGPAGSRQHIVRAVHGKVTWRY